MVKTKTNKNKKIKAVKKVKKIQKKIKNSPLLKKKTKVAAKVTSKKSSLRKTKVSAQKIKKESPRQKKQNNKKIIATPSVLGYTSAQLEKYKQLKNNFTGKTNQQLKDLLRKNFQSMSGNKTELIQKCADGAVLGRIPRCPSCFGGRPAFDYKKGTYFCSGYRDDVDYINCKKTFTLPDLIRTQWEA